MLEKQIEVLQRRLQLSSSEEQCEHYHLGLRKLEAELEDLIKPSL